MSSATTYSAEYLEKRKWPVFLGVLLLTAACVGLGAGSLSVFTPLVADHLEVGRATLTAYDFPRNMLGAACLLFYSKIYRKVGARGICTLGGLGFGAILAIQGLTDNVYLIWFVAFFTGVCELGAGISMFSILPPWFGKKVGLYIGLCSCTTGIVGTFTSRIAYWLIDRVGLDMAMIIEGVVVIVCGLVAAALVATHPDDPVAGERAIAEEKLRVADSGNQLVGSAAYYKKALSTPAILACVLVCFLIGGFGNAMTRGIVSVATARGFANPSLPYSVHYTTIIFAKIAVGWLRERVPLPFLFGGLIAANVANCFILGFGPESMAVVTGICYGIGASMIQLATGFFMMEALGKYYESGLMGIGQAIFCVGIAIFVPLYHVPYDMSGSYDVTMIVWAIGFVATYLIYLFGARRLGAKLQAQGEAQGAQSFMEIK